MWQSEMRYTGYGGISYKGKTSSANFDIASVRFFFSRVDTLDSNENHQVFCFGLRCFKRSDCGESFVLVSRRIGCTVVEYRSARASSTG